MATVTLGSKTIGDTVKLKENGVLAEFYVLSAGTGGVLLIRKYCHSNRVWKSSGSAYYSGSSIDTWLNNDYLNMLDETIREAIVPSTIYYSSQPKRGYTSTMQRSVYLVSRAELVSGYDDCRNPEGGTLSTASLIRSCSSVFWTRSPYVDSENADSDKVWVDGGGNSRAADTCTSSRGVRPMFRLASSLLVTDNGTVTANTAPPTPASITIPSSVQGGSTITVSWTASTDAEGNLEGYKVERSTDGGSTWTQIYQGSARNTTNAVAFGTASVMYRVKAYDTEGLESSWRTSQSVTVINNLAPTAPAGISVPLNVSGGKPLTITWTAAADSDGNLSGYALERQDNGGAWSELCRGPSLTYTDSIPKGLQTVAYRVRAYDTLDAFGPYTTSETRTVNNNTAPVIACDAGDLGERSEGFEVPYSVSDEDGDDITVTEAVDGKMLQSFQAEDGAENTVRLTGADFMQVLNGPHELTITASDGKEQSVHKLAFTKSVTEASVTLAEPLPADAPITVCALSVSGSIPADAEYTVEVTNNALDASPVWENCTAAVRSGANIVFAHQADSGHAFNFRLYVKRGPSGQGGYITSIQGGFQ